MAIIAFIASLIYMLISGILSQEVIWYITPGSGNNAICSHWKNCSTLDQFIGDNSNGFSATNLTLLLLPGAHTLSSNLELSNMDQLLLRGLNSTLTTAVICNASSESGVYFSSIKKISIEFINFEYCAADFGKQTQATLYVQHAISLQLSHIWIQKSRGYGLYVEENMETKLQHCYFEYNYRGLFYNNTNNLYAGKNNMSVYLRISYSSFLNSTNDDNADNNQASGIHIVSSGPSFLVSFQHCLLENNDRNVLIELSGSNVAPTNTHVLISNSEITSGRGLRGAGLFYSILPTESSGDELSCARLLTTNTLTIKHTLFANNEATYAAGGLLIDFHDNSCTYNKVKLYNCSFLDNSIQSESIEQGTGAALLVLRHLTSALGGELTYLKYAMSFEEIKFNRNSVTSPKGAIVEFINNQHAEFLRCNFLNNNGTALSLHSSSVIFSNHVTFRQNSATFGGAIQLCEASYFFIRNSTTVLFENNFASQRGGAIYGQKSCIDKHDYCFFQPVVREPTSVANLLVDDNMKLVFNNNTAVRAGDNIYGGHIDHCYTFGKFYNHSTTLPSSHYLSGNVFDTIAEFHGSNRNASISSDPYFIYFCNSLTNERNIGTWPGSTIQVSVQPLGQREGFTKGLIEVVYNSNQISASVSRSLSLDSCENMNITIFSKHTHVMTNLTFQLQSSIPIEDVMVATLHVKIQDCPWGFYLNTGTGKCECSPLFEGRGCCKANDFLIDCSDSTFWIGCDNDTSCVASTDVRGMPCKVGYCKGSRSVIDGNVNDQCVAGRMGTGCGQCRQNYSAVLGTSNCRICSNSHLWLIVIYLLSGFILIVLLMKLNITVANGTLNATIFYANFVYINKDIFFPSKFSNWDIFRIVISWLNLDIGFEVCFYKGMTVHQKTWLEFGYVLYIWSLQVAIVYLCRKFILVTRICGRNVTKVMATVLLITYTKVLRAIQTTLLFEHMQYIPSPTRYQHKYKVWLPNPAILFGSSKHIPMLITAMLLGLLLFSFTFCLLSIQALKKASHRKGLTWVARLQPFFDTFTGPCNSSYAFWPGFLFLMRIALTLLHSFHTSSLSPLSHDKAIASCTVAILVIVLSFLYPSGVYKMWSLNIFELSVMLNLALLSGLVNITDIFKSHDRIQYITHASILLFMCSLLCYKSKKIYMAVRKSYLVCLKQLTSILSHANSSHDYREKMSSTNRVTHSEIQVSIPPNESSPLLCVSSSPHAKSFHDPRETLLEWDD